MSIQFRPAASRDVDDAYSWYEGERPGFGEEFLDALLKQLMLIDGQPNLFAPIHETTRAAPMRRFPYVIYYVVAGDVVTVIGVIHGRRHARHWRERL